MSLILRIVAVVAAIYWLSPVRDRGEAALDRERFSSIVRALEALPPDERGRAIEALATIAVGAPDSAAALLGPAGRAARVEDKR
jgi:hypothetical protein